MPERHAGGLDLDGLREALLRRDARALGRAATLIERQTDAGRELMSQLYGCPGNGTVIGVTGPPGAGKSTLIAQMIRHLRTEGRTVAVLAIDPSSALSGGAVLGDRIRMAEHHSDRDVFIRSLATHGDTGGLTESAFDLVLLLQAAGFDSVIVETVGTGQTQTEVSAIADLTILVLTPESGDDVQALKAGMMEIADVYALNKADLPGIERLEQEIRFVQNLSPRNRSPAPICRVTANVNDGVEALMTTVDSLIDSKGHMAQRHQVCIRSLQRLVQQEIASRLNPQALHWHATRILARGETPREAVRQLLAQITQAEKGS